MRTNYFQFNETDFGVGEIRFSLNELESTFTLEISANLAITERISTDEQAEFGWVLYPPKLYFRNVPFSQVASKKQLKVDERILDNYDVALYMLEHCDVVGTAELTATAFTLIGCAQVDGVDTSLAVGCLLPR